METLRVKTDASVKDDKIGIGYVLYSREEDNYREVLRESQKLDASYDSHTAEQVAILKGLSVAKDHYTGGTVAVMTDCKGIVDKVQNRRMFSDNRQIRSSLSNLTDLFEEVVIKWIPSEENTIAHEACRSAVES